MLEGRVIQGLVTKLNQRSLVLALLGGLAFHLIFCILVYQVKKRVAVQSCLNIPIDLGKNISVAGCCSVILLLGVSVQHSCSSKTSSCSYLSPLKCCFSVHENT